MMSKIKELLSEFDDWKDVKETLIEGIKYELTERANKRGSRRMFVLKTASMQGKIPQCALPSEKGELERQYGLAYIAKNEQELYEEIAKLLEKKLKAYKKNSDKPIEKIDYKKCQSYNKLASVNKEAVDRCLGEKILGVINEQISQKQIDVQLFENIIKELKQRSISCRQSKQMYKGSFEDDLKKVKYGIKLAKKYGELEYEVDNKGKPKSCKHNEKWYKHRDDNKLSAERLEILKIMKEQ